MKRVNAITRCKGILAETLDRKASRILRQVNQAIDAAKDKAADLEEKAEEIINSLGTVAGADDTFALQAKINKYLDTCSEVEGYQEAVKRLEALKEKLNAEVEVVEDEDGNKTCKNKK